MVLQITTVTCKNKSYCKNLYLLFYAFLFGFSLSSLFSSSFFFPFLSLCPAAHSLYSALPNSSLNLSQTLFLSLALALPLLSASGQAQAQSRTRTPTLIGIISSGSVNDSLSGWIAGPWVVGRPRQRQMKELNRLVVVEDFLNFIEYVTKRPYKNMFILFAVTPLYNIHVQF